uniref:Uncharacterized protein n=1 Tax=Mastacembelus armatus TaxID=205130 RepID=A0A3Q3MDX0_9TELE
MDTELFMECEEEELEPWQQVDDISLPQIVSSSVMPPPPPPPSSATSSTSSSSSVPRLPAPSTPVVTTTPLVAQAPPIILTQAAGGTFLLPAPPGTGNAQPILLTTQVQKTTAPFAMMGFPVVNPGTPLLLNLQPGQTVQPLTLIQCRPTPIQTRPGPVPSGGPAQPVSTLSAMQLPATLTIRTSTPGPGQCTGHTGRRFCTELMQQQDVSVSGSCVVCWKDPERFTLTATFCQLLFTFQTQFMSHKLHFNSFFVSPGPAASAPTLNVITTPTVSSAPSSDPPNVVMGVEDFYYGTFEGDMSLRKPHPLELKTTSFTCQICTHLTENNLRLMQHMLQHSELIGGGGDERKCCKFCYRQFSSPAQLQTHQEQVHGPALSSSMCRICEWAFENEPAFLNHMKSNHKPGEMPYICQVCSYRSSFYSDVLQHFANFHRDSRFLLCVFCLKVTRNPASYQQHLLRHQINQAFHCNRCRLQFVFLKDKMQHKLENHRSFRRPAQLAGLPPGPTIRLRSTSTSQTDDKSQSPLQQVRPTSESTSTDRLVCLECGTDASDFSAHYPTHVHCLLCPYSSCCSRAYSSDWATLCLVLSPFQLQCSQCDFGPQRADQMADHLLMNPEHHSATCRTRSKKVEMDETNDNVDGAMAPVEDMDFSDDERDDDLGDIEEADDIKEEFIKEVKQQTSHLPTTNNHVHPAAILSATKGRNDFFTARQLRIALFALCDGLRQASRVFSTDMELIRTWLKEAKKRFRRSEQEHKDHGDGGDRMVAWVLSMREQQLSITESNLFHKASTLKKKGGFSDSFLISYDWAVSFMLQHRLGVRRIGRAPTLGRTLPASLEAKVQSFQEFTKKIIKVHKLSESTVAVMDELCLFVDLRLLQDKCRCSQALELTGSLPLVTVYLAVLADGTMLPSLVLANRQLAKKDLPEFILLEAGPDSLLVEEALDLWTNKVWLQHVSGPTPISKSMLVLDRHREHMGDQFLTSVSGSGTLPAVIPGGCSFCLQPLEICVKPVLQRFLLSRWAKFTSRNPKELEELSPYRLQANVAQLLVDWVVEALTHLNKLPQLWKKSFHLADLLPGLIEHDGEEETSQKPEEIQMDLLKTLTKTLFGSEVLETDGSDPLELEDEEDSEEEQGREEGQETSEEKQEAREEGEEDREILIQELNIDAASPHVTGHGLFHELSSLCDLQ